MSPSSPSSMSPVLKVLLVFLALFANEYTQVEAQVTADSSEATTRILFVFDASNSMNAFWGGQRKIETATKLLAKTLSELRPIGQLELGLRVYGHGTTHIPGQQNCDDTELVVPFGPNDPGNIEAALRRLQARGTTPIARSLEEAAYDFPDIESRNVIILITDGIEACDEDPCVVSRALKAKGILVKPFVIGMGIDEDMAAALHCIGSFFDAADPDSFEVILELVLEQALHNTSVSVELLDSTGESTITNLPYTFTDVRSGEHNPQWFHTMSRNFTSDTMYVDPLPTYNFTVHSLPPRHLDSIALKPGVHNVISVPDMGQGKVTPQFASGALTGYGSIDVTWMPAGGCLPFYSGPVGHEVQVCEGTYDVTFATLPKTVIHDVDVRDQDRLVVEIPPPGALRMTRENDGYIVILEAASNDVVVQWSPEQFAGKLTLQPGDYVLLYRAKHAVNTLKSFRTSFTIQSGKTNNLHLHG